MDSMEVALGEGQLTPEFLNKEEREQFMQADLGLDVLTFLETDAWIVLRGAALQDRQEAMEKLARISLWRWKDCRRLQNRIALADMMLGYMAELMRNGELAEQTLKVMREDYE